MVQGFSFCYSVSESMMRYRKGVDHACVPEACLVVFCPVVLHCNTNTPQCLPSDMTYLGICVPGAEEIAGNPLKPVISHFPSPNQCDNRALPCCLVDVNTLMASSWRGSMSLLPCPHLGHPQPLRSVHSVRSRQSCHPPSRTQPMKPFIFHHALPCPLSNPLAT